MREKFCETCGLRAPAQNVCSLTRLKVDPKKDFCSRHCEHPHKCDLCGGLFIESPYIDITNSTKLLVVCPECKAAYHYCPTCTHSQSCAFETDPSTLPKMVQKQVRKGNMIAVTTIRNPERIAITCAKSCSCYDPETKECVRENLSCPNYRFIKGE